MLAVAQDRDGVAEIEHLAQTMADIEDRVSARLECFQHVDDARNLVVGQRRGRLVEDEETCVAGEKPRDFDELLLADAERAHRSIQIPITRAQCFEGIVRATAQVAAAVKHRNVGTPEPDVVEHGESRREAQLLGDQPKTQRLRMLGAAHGLAHTVDRDRTRVGRENAHQQFDQGALAGAVFAADRTDFARAQRKRDVTQRAHAAEALAQSLDGKTIHRAASSSCVTATINRCRAPAIERGSPW